MILTALLLWSIVTPHQASPPPADDFGIVEGTVVDPSGNPVAGATVYASSKSYPELPLQGRLHDFTTESDSNGDFVLTHVVPAKDVVLFAFKYSDYYEDPAEPFTFNRLQGLMSPEVEVGPGQTVTGIVVRLHKQVGKLHFYFRDAKTKELVHGIFERLCPRGHPQNCITGSNQSDFESLISLGVEISIEIEADDGLHKKWKYRNPKSGSPYFIAKSGETEMMDVYLRKK